jgi:hypothetical protein
MDKLATIRVLIAVSVVAVLGIGVSVEAAGAKPVDPDCSVVPKMLCSPTTKRLPNVTPAVNFSAPRTRSSSGSRGRTGTGSRASTADLTTRRRGQPEKEAA